MTRFRLAFTLAALCACSVLPEARPAPLAPQQPPPAAAAAAPATPPLSFALDTYALENGLTVVLMEDHSVPSVVIDTWFGVGSKDEELGRSGFAHLFEHLMFMGTRRVPGAQFDLLMERGGGSNNASTGSDRTNYYSQGPAALLPTLLWLDAERLDALDDEMTQAKLDRQRDIVRNERRQNIENVPYGKAELLLPEALYPPEHPYYHPVIGNHEDLQAAKLADVIAFFRRYYSAANATLVIAGDFQPAAVKPLVQQYFGALPKQLAPPKRVAGAAALERESRILDYDRVEFPKLYLTWHSPRAFAQGDAELDLLARILAEGPSSRLEKRLVLEKRLAQDVSASQDSQELGSTFNIEAVAAPGVELEAIKTEIMAVIEELLRDGPTEAELRRAQALTETGFRRSIESLLGRAENVQQYHANFGVSDGFQRDLERWTLATTQGVRDTARSVLGPGRVDLRILPQGNAASAAAAGSPLDQRPHDFAPQPPQLPEPARFELSNGIPVYLLRRSGSGLLSGTLITRGGEAAVPVAEMGSALLAARWIESGAGGRDKSEFASAAESLGARLSAGANRLDMSFGISALVSRLPETLDLFADLVLRPNLTPPDFAREQQLLASAIRARDDNPGAVATNTARSLLFGAQDPRGRPVEGSLQSVGALTPEGVAARLPGLLAPSRAAFTFAGDIEPEALRTLLEARFGSWRTAATEPAPELAPRSDPPAGRIVFVHREQAPQTVIQILRPIPPAEGVQRAVRDAVDTLFGGSFTSRLNANLREDKGYTYGARSQVFQDGTQFLMTAGASVVTQSTGASLSEFKKEFARLAAGNVPTEELAKAVELNRSDSIQVLQTTAAANGALAELVRDGRPLEAWSGDVRALSGVELGPANQLARSGLYDWNRCLVVLVGDRTAILKQLSAAGFPRPTEVDSLGRELESSVSQNQR